MVVSISSSHRQSRFELTTSAPRIPVPSSSLHGLLFEGVFCFCNPLFKVYLLTINPLSNIKLVMIVFHSLGFFTQFFYLCGNFLVLRSPTCQLLVINLRQMEFHRESSFWHLYNIGYYICFLLLVSVFPVTLKPLIHLKLAFVQHNRHKDMQFSQCQF